MGDKVGENPAALRAAVFLLSAKNRRGGGVFKHPPSRAKVNMKDDLAQPRAPRHSTKTRAAAAVAVFVLMGCCPQATLHHEQIT